MTTKHHAGSVAHPAQTFSTSYYAHYQAEHIAIWNWLAHEWCDPIRFRKNGKTYIRWKDAPIKRGVIFTDAEKWARIKEANQTGAAALADLVSLVGLHAGSAEQRPMPGDDA